MRTKFFTAPLNFYIKLKYMKQIIIIIFFIIALITLFDYHGNQKEGYNGALLQLVAKGPQDTYLTGDAWKYIPPYYYGYGGYPYFWYNATRPGRYYGRYYPKYSFWRVRPRFYWYSPWGRAFYR